MDAGAGAHNGAAVSVFASYESIQAYAQKNGNVRQRVCDYFEQDHLQGSDAAVLDVATCCKGALWADVLSFTRANFEDIDRFEYFLLFISISWYRIDLLTLVEFLSVQSPFIFSEVSIAKIFLGIATSKYPKFRSRH